MESPFKLKLFISYSHNDESLIDEFRKHISPLKENGAIDEWYDRKILGGEEFQDTIDNNLDSASIICLFISKNFISSSACMDEKKRAFQLKSCKGIKVLPIILSPCAWREDSELKKILAVPTDGKEVTSFQSNDEGWMDVYLWLKDIIKNVSKYKKLSLKKEFLQFLDSPELLSRAHSQKEKLTIDEIFVYPDLEQYDHIKGSEKIVKSKELIDEILLNEKILLAGENQSGKTTLCKKIFFKLHELSMIPVYIQGDSSHSYQGLINTIINKRFAEQYEGLDFENIDKVKIVPILDNFHYAKEKEKHINDLSEYNHQVIIVDDIFGLNLKNESLITAYNNYKIKELSPSLRNKLIRKWALIDQQESPFKNENEFYRDMDNKEELINSTLGIVIGNGIMPAYPFFILSIISAYDTANPLNQEITSQGYCYQALIYLYLRKQGVKNEDIDIYINFLTEFSFFIYKLNKNEIPQEDFGQFMEAYLEKFNMPIDQDFLISRLRLSRIIHLDSFLNYSFCYQYIYYYFVAKYIAEHIKDTKNELSDIVTNLQRDENAYICIFITHHTRDDHVLDEIILTACDLFSNYQPATLSKKELQFFDHEVSTIIKAVVQLPGKSPEKEREDRLKAKDDEEENNHNGSCMPEVNDSDDLTLALRKSLKTVEVMGSIIKQRSGSLRKERLEFIFEEAMNVLLRILSSFFELIKKDEGQREIIDYISGRLEKYIEKNEEKKPYTREELIKISRKIFWNTNFFIVYGCFEKMVQSLGSNKLNKVIDTVCNKLNTPSAFLLKHGILMWNHKNLQVDNISEKIKGDDFSETAIQVIKMMIINHCSMHSIGYKDKQKLEEKFGLPAKKLLLQESKGKVQ